MPFRLIPRLNTSPLFSLLGGHLLFNFSLNLFLITLLLYSSLLSLLTPITATQAVQWTLIENFSFHEHSYSMHWRPHRHQHYSSNDSFSSAEQGATTIPAHLRPIRIVVLAPFHSTEDYSLEKIMPAIVAAVRSIVEEASKSKGQLYRGWEHGATIDFVDTKCSSAIGPLVAFDYYIRGKVDVFLGPVCPYVLAPVARYTSFWDVPHLTSAGQVSMFDDKNITFRILTRMNGSFSQMGQFFNQILNRFNWKTVFFLYTDPNDRSKGHSLCHFSLASVFMSMGPKAVELKRSFDEEEEESYEDYLKDASMKSRIIIMCAKKDTVRRIMITAYKMGMVQTGEFVFITVELTTGLDASQRPWERDDASPEENVMAKEAYTSLIRVTPKMPQTATINSFLESVTKIAMTEFNYSQYGRGEVSSYATAFHEAVHLYALGLNDTLSDGHSAPNGTQITRYMWDRTFMGIAGNVTIDANGDRLVDYSLFDMNPVTGDFEAVMIFDSKLNEFFELPGKKIHWTNDRFGPPPDTPPCGFEGELCLSDEAEYSQKVLIIASATLSLLLFCTFIVFIFVYRHYRLEAELASMTWKIRFEDIQTNTPGLSHMAKMGSRMSLTRVSISSDTMPLVNGTHGGAQMFARTGIYRNVVVALKPIEKTRFELTRSLLIELKNMKNLQHNHIVTFIGACLEPTNNSCFIVTEYCPKGSLQDILENEEIKLDWMFRYSLMHDIIKGMSFLHASEMHVHGNLKSSNCVVDSRFVLKITDFGLHSLRQPNLGSSNRLPLPNEVDETHYSYWRQKFWTAPELLRLWLKSAECNGIKQQQQLQSQILHGTQKGDIYSFAIICHEIILRQGTFYLGEDEDLSPREIIYNVCENGLRPRLEEYMAEHEAVLQMVNRCWHEDPNERPDFVTLQSIIRRINKENESSNILDNLLKRMEQYANNLESLVQERTSDYLEEKRKAEDLLYQLLPRSVASQLIRGQSVRAEAFQEVTIYFSDIVGFTKLSAQSTPMQVVDVLNDLYTCFDSTIENFDVYKVETIGDAYMVVSGLPVRNGDRHAREIAKMSLTLLNAVRSFKIRHRPGEQLMLRIGIHSGSCVAGVVGMKMPRYCLFGDTVNTASRMESTGLPLRIHVSQSTKTLLDNTNEFELSLRGEIDVKGKGVMTTYWLTGLSDQTSTHNYNNITDTSDYLWTSSQRSVCEGCSPIEDGDSSERSLHYYPPEVNSKKNDLAVDLTVGLSVGIHESNSLSTVKISTA